MSRDLGGAKVASCHCRSPGGLSNKRGREITVTNIVTVHPGYVVLSRPATVLSPGKQGRILRTIDSLGEQRKIAIVLVARCVRRIIRTSGMCIVSGKRIIVRKAPERVFSRIRALGRCELSIPRMALLTRRLRGTKISIPRKVLAARRLIGTLYR